MRLCVQYIGEMRLKSASCERISPVRHGRFHTVGVVTQALLRLVVGVGGGAVDIYLTLNNCYLERSLKVIESGTIQKLGCGLVFAFHSNYGRIFNHL